MGWREDNIALVERHFRLEEKGDSPAVLDDMADPPEYVVPALSAGVIATREEIAQIHRYLYDAFTPLRVITEQLTVAEDRVAAQVLVGGVHTGEFFEVAPTGKEIYFHVCSVFEIADGKITRETVYSDPGEFARLATGSDAALEIEFQTTHGAATDATVDAWELKAARRALRNLKTLLHGEPMRELLAEQIVAADARAQEILAGSNGEFRECRVDVTVKGLSATQFAQSMTSKMPLLAAGTPAQAAEVATSWVYPAHPEHYVVPPYMGIVETLGGFPTRVRIILTDDLPPFVTSCADDSYPTKMGFRAELDDGSVFAWLLHEFRDTEAAGDIVLRVLFPATAPDVYFDEHAEHFAVEFRNWIRAAAADIAAADQG